MTQEQGEKREVPEVEADFTSLLKKFRIGLKDGLAENITENISRTGGELVFEDPELLAERLVSWHADINPVKRRQILEQWFAERKIEVPEGILELAGGKAQDVKEKQEAKQKEAEEKEAKKSKFFVEEDTGRIRAARGDERPLIWDEALQVSERIKNEIEAKGKETAEPAFIISAEGEWTVNPKAKLSFADVMVWDMYQKSQAKGEEKDPWDIMTEQASKIEMLRTVFGGGKETGSLADMVEALLKLQTLTGGDTETKRQLEAISKRLEEGTAPKVESDEMKLMRAEITELKDAMRRKEMDELTGQLNAMRQALLGLQSRLDKSELAGRSKSEYDIMGKTLDLIDRRLGDIGNTVGSFLRRPPKPLTAEHKEEITQAIEEQVATEGEVDDLAKKLWGAPQQTPAQ